MDKELSLIEHLSELRKRIIYCLAPFLLATVFGAAFAKPVLGLLRLPAKDVIEKLAFFSPQEVAVVYIKTAMFSGLVLSLPVILYQIWQFISPALEERHRKNIFSFVFWTLFAFLAGSCFGYFVLVPVSLKFLLAIAGNEFTPVISISKYISFVLLLILGCGIVFEMPVAVWLLSKLKVINARFLRRKRKYAIVAIFILAAIITPTTDPFTMCLLAVPMVLLYELSIWVSHWSQK